MGEKKIVYYTFKDILAIFACLTFTLISFIVSPIYWFGFLFFGLGSLILLFKYLNPKNKVLNWHSSEAKKIRDKEQEVLYNLYGDFQFIDWGFININDEEFALEWDNVKKITIYKRDLITEDQICLEITHLNDTVFTISEDTKGWFQLIKHLSNEFPEVNEENIMKIAQPAFARNETVLFSREMKGNDFPN